MEAESFNSNPLPDGLNRLLPVVVPVLLISVGYVDPGKWAATVEGGARFGFDLVVLMLVFNFAAILCQYLSARIGLVTGRDLAQVSYLSLRVLLMLKYYLSLSLSRCIVTFLVLSCVIQSPCCATLYLFTLGILNKFGMRI
jgi:NRAMP (natural resistance-associated macrophage protein)-like metal ion transporter